MVSGRAATEARFLGKNEAWWGPLWKRVRHMAAIV